MSHLKVARVLQHLDREVTPLVLDLLLCCQMADHVARRARGRLWVEFGRALDLREESRRREAEQLGVTQQREPSPVCVG